MKLFKIKNENIEQIKNDPFKLERDIQDVVEKNVNTLFDVEFVKSEFKIKILDLIHYVLIMIITHLL